MENVAYGRYFLLAYPIRRFTRNRKEKALLYLNPVEYRRSKGIGIPHLHSVTSEVPLCKTMAFGAFTMELGS